MPQSASAGILVVWTDIAPDIEADFNNWYNREHLPDRIPRMPGFVRGRRYVAQSGAPKYLTCYDLQSTAVMLSDAHTALRKARTARDQFFVPRFRNTIKGICDVVGRAGNGEGGVLVLLPVAADAGREQALARCVCDSLLPALAAARGIASATYAVRNAAVTQASAARDDRSGDRYLDGLIAVEVTDEAGVTRALDALRMQRLADMGGRAQWMDVPCVLRLSFDLQRAASSAS